jgi:hypothetical protein
MKGFQGTGEDSSLQHTKENIQLSKTRNFFILNNANTALLFVVHLLSNRVLLF